MTTSEIGKITGYHAHIYYHSETRETAAKIRDALDAKFRGAIRLGRWHDKNIGPHTRSMYKWPSTGRSFRKSCRGWC